MDLLDDTLGLLHFLDLPFPPLIELFLRVLLADKLSSVLTTIQSTSGNMTIYS